MLDEYGYLRLNGQAIMKFQSCYLKEFVSETLNRYMKTITYLILTVATFASVVVGQERAPRFEVGAQFTLLSGTPPAPAPQFPSFTNGNGRHTEPGVGGRFTFNFTDNIALEAEGNFFTRDLTGSSDLRTNLPNPS